MKVSTYTSQKLHQSSVHCHTTPICMTIMHSKFSKNKNKNVYIVHAIPFHNILASEFHTLFAYNRSTSFATFCFHLFNFACKQ